MGGGSTEIVVGTAAAGVDLVGLAAGRLGLADRRRRAGGPTVARRSGAAAAPGGRACAGVRPPPGGGAYAVGGSATSLRRLAGPVLDMDALARAGDVVCGQPCETLARRYDLHAERARLLPAGLLLLEAASALLGLPLRVAAGGCARA